MEMKDVLELIFNRANATQTFWNFYLIVFGAILGLIGSLKPNNVTPRLKVILMIGFTLFFISNYISLSENWKQRHGLYELARQTEEYKKNNKNGQNKYDPILESTTPPCVEVLMIFHFAADAFVLLILCFVGGNHPFTRDIFQKSP